MKAPLRTLCVLLCVGIGHGAPAGTAQTRAAAPQTELQSRAAAAGDGPSHSSASGTPLPRPRRSPPDPPCALRSVLVQVRDLGLGYDSDEEVLFKFCSGACPQLRSNHDLALGSLLQSGLLPEGGAARHYAPCCRPTHHEDMAFLDNKHRWHKVERLSAADCHCVG